ncbi:MAG: thioredoxin domain-containing protein [Deltaproteobacteria bacterium]|nr:thioredoxin domain-containing protein [Deltaproteobacteria bacterium]MBW2136225.1 thioredoxin domain-containing protein [Deltaproteobacteria bacterium]
MMEHYPREVNLVIKNYPLVGIHTHAMMAAKAALAAHRQGKFQEVHFTLFKNYKRLNEDRIERIAQELGLDMDRFHRDLNSPEVERLIERDRSEAKRLGVKSVPAVFINGRLLKDRSMKGFRDLIERQLRGKGEGP